VTGKVAREAGGVGSGNRGSCNAARGPRERNGSLNDTVAAQVTISRKTEGRWTVSESTIDFSKYEEKTFESFRRRAVNPTLSLHEKVGFPDSYREGKEAEILDDIVFKLTNLRSQNQIVVDLGAGCSGLATLLMDHCGERGSQLFQVDSPEMLALLPEALHVSRMAGRFPDACTELFDAVRGRANCVLAYSVLSCVFAEANVFDFVDRALDLLASGGQLLLADLPNVSKRKRFFVSEAGIRFHQEFTGTSEMPSVEFNVPEPGAFDDAVVLALVARCRLAGFDAYVLPQAEGLPMSNRREDILVTKP